MALLSADARRTLARAIEIDGNAEIVSSPSIKTGTGIGLVRQWLGKVHIVPEYNLGILCSSLQNP
jgi:hypothetical protein